MALGLRQGEVLGLRWTDIDFKAKVLTVREARKRPKWRHGCAGAACGKKPGYCAERVNERAVTGPTKSKAGRRRIALPEELITILKAHRRWQLKDKKGAGQLWKDQGWVFAKASGEAVNPNTDYHNWKLLLEAAGVVRKRLHDLRHTAATVLLLLGVSERVVMDIMGWSSVAMIKRYQHVTDTIRHAVAEKVGGMLWGDDTPEEDDDEGPTWELVET